MRWRPPSTRPCCSHALRMRLTVCSVVPVISATSCRLIGKSISTPAVDLAPGLLGQTQQRVRDSLLDLLVGHLEHAGLGVLQAAADGLQRIRGERGKFRDQPRPRERWPGERDAVDRRDGGRRIVAVRLMRLRDAEESRPAET